MAFGLQTVSAQFSMEKISTYYTDVFDEGSVEILAYDPVTFTVFFTNADANSIGVLDISNPNDPTLVTEISQAPYGGGVNSVAVNNGIVAVAVEAEDKTQNGKVVFWTTKGEYISDVEVGALPDMLTFTNDGSKVLVANEGEPNDDYSVDPEGSISIIDISGGAASASATQINFNSYDDKMAHLTNKGVRIFGPGASVSQDLEPEYIAVTEDDSKAYVACQENNALVVVNIETAEIMDIYALGTKDHNSGAPELLQFNLNEISGWPALGTPVYDGGQDPVMLGGFSGLYFDQAASTATNYVFYAVPDRGPNDGAVNRSTVMPAAESNLRPFKLPDYQGRIAKFSVNLATASVTLDEQILLTRKDGQTPITGRGNVPGWDETPVTYTDANTAYANEDFVGEDGETYHLLEFDPFGGDFEGIQKDNLGNFWMCDEYRPAIYNFAPDGTLIERYVPAGTSMLGTDPQASGFYGAETLPAVYAKRRANRGFEALAYDGDNNIVYAFIQSPLYNPNSSTRNNSDVIRILGVDATDGTPVSEYVYLLERNKDSGSSLGRVDKIGDAVYIGDGQFMILERDSSVPGQNTGKKYVYKLSLKGATNILGTAISMKEESTGPDDKTLEMMTADDLASAGINAVYKTKVLNLPSVGYLPSDKPEGIAVLPNGALVVLNDNDFGLAGAGVSDNSTVGIINFGDNYGLDASNRSADVDIRNWPVEGYFLPDAITSFAHNGENYIITANEGDGRDYDTYSDEERVEDLTLDAETFPNAAMMQMEENLGRLKTTNASGDIDGDGDHDVIYTYGARSFSIFDEFGNLVYDSGDDFEQKTLEAIPDYFNSTNDDNDSFKNRSDDKGPEPEAVTVAMVNGTRYALIGLERVGGIMVYDITDPKNPSFVSYTNNRDFSADAESREAGDLGVEDIKFVPAAQSPTRQDLVMTANEVSGTLTLFGVNPREKDIIFDEEINITDYEPTTVVAPPSPLETEVIFVGGHDVVQTTAHYGNPAGQAIAKEWHDFIGFTPDTTGESMGWVTVNHETIYRDDRMGDGGGMTAFRVAKSADGGIDVVEQELEDGREGHFFNVDFANTVGETGMNCGGIIGPNGRIWTAEEWFRSSTGSIWNSSARTSSLPYRVAGLTSGWGVRDTSPYTITAPEFPQVDGKTIDKFQNFNYMTEVDPRQARAIRKQYNWGRAGWEGGAITNDGKYVYLGIDGVPAPWVRFTADTPFDFTVGTLEVYKHDNPVGQRWIEVPMDNDDVIFGGLTDYAWSVGATMYMRNEWVVIDRETGIVYWTETGRDSGSSGPGIVFNALTASTSAVTAPHHEALARQRGHESATDTDYQDYYGRVLYYDPATEEVGVTIDGGPYFEQSPSVADYPSTHLSNPDGLSIMTIDGQNFLLICEDLNGSSFGRSPEGISNRLCELFLLDTRIMNATVNDLVRVTAIPRGAEVTGAVQIDANTVLFNSQHPNPNNPFPYNHSLTMAINGFEGVTLNGLKNGSNEAGMKVNQVSRQVHMNAKSDYAIYDGEGKRKKVYRNTDQFSIAELEAGKYMVLSAEDEAYELIVQ